MPKTCENSWDLIWDGENSSWWSSCTWSLIKFQTLAFDNSQREVGTCENSWDFIPASENSSSLSSCIWYLTNLLSLEVQAMSKEGSWHLTLWMPRLYTSDSYGSWMAGFISSSRIDFTPWVRLAGLWMLNCRHGGASYVLGGVMTLNTMNV